MNAAILERKASSDVEHVAHFRDSIERAYDEQLRELNARAATHDDHDYYADILADEAYVLEEILQIGREMSMVALYRIVELNTILALRWRWPDAENRGYYRIDNLSQQLRTHLSIDLRSLPGFPIIDELRCANNAVKHERRVTPALAEFPGWTQGDKLTGLAELFDKAAAAIPSYLRALAEAVVPRHTSESSPQTAILGSPLSMLAQTLDSLRRKQ